MHNPYFISVKEEIFKVATFGHALFYDRGISWCYQSVNFKDKARMDLVSRREPKALALSFAALEFSVTFRSTMVDFRDRFLHGGNNGFSSIWRGYIKYIM